MRFLVLLVAMLLPATALCAGESPAPGDLQSVFFGLPVTNTVLTSWCVTLVFLAGLRFAIGRPRVIPNRAQAVAETVVVALRDLLAPIVGRKAMPFAFPVLVTLFIFILVQNWVGLLPGVGTVGWGVGESFYNTHVETPLVRPPTSDINGTIALAVVSFGAWLILVLKFAGPRAILKDWFGNKADKSELPRTAYWALSGVFLGVGIIEVISVMIRPMTLSMRLFGNVFGGENLLHKTHFAPPFYFLELLVGLVQALVFTLLSAVYIGLLCNHGDGDEKEGQDSHAH